MKNKYTKVGLDYELISDKYKNLEEYENIINVYFSDPFFKELGDYLDNEDYALAKDAVKGLFILAQELYLMSLYVALMDIYEDLEDEFYKDVKMHYEEMLKVYEKLREAFSC